MDDFVLEQLFAVISVVITSAFKIYSISEIFEFENFRNC